MSAGQINRFKKLYGQEILDNDMNLEQRIIYEIKQDAIDSEVTGTPSSRGRKQALISNLVSTYRDLAKQRMVGDADGEPVDIGLKNPDGTPDIRIEFPELGAKMRRNRTISDTYGK